MPASCAEGSTISLERHRWEVARTECVNALGKSLSEKAAKLHQFAIGATRCANVLDPHTAAIQTPPNSNFTTSLFRLQPKFKHNTPLLRLHIARESSLEIHGDPQI